MSKCALLTITRNEKHFFPLWYQYYSQTFADKDIYVLDHDSTDNHLHHDDVNVKVIRNGGKLDRPWMRQMVMNAQAELLGRYEYVLFTEIDEFVVPDPVRYHGLSHYIREVHQQWVRCRGYDIVHATGESGLEIGRRPWLAQRSLWMYNPLFYSKTLLARKPLYWGNGFHNVKQDRTNKQPPESDELYLLHFQFACLELCFRRWRDRQVDNRAYDPNLFVIKELRDGMLPRCELIPDRWRKAL